jgi:hypothetical protein
VVFEQAEGAHCVVVVTSKGVAVVALVAVFAVVDAALAVGSWPDQEVAPEAVLFLVV